MDQIEGEERSGPGGLMAKGIDCDIEVGEFELHSQPKKIDMPLKKENKPT